MSKSFKYVKDFAFPSECGFTGSAGSQMVKGYARGGEAKMPAAPKNERKEMARVTRETSSERKGAGAEVKRVSREESYDQAKVSSPAKPARKSYPAHSNVPMIALKKGGVASSAVKKMTSSNAGLGEGGMEEAMKPIYNAGKVGAAVGRATKIPMAGKIGRTVAENIAVNRMNKAKGGMISSTSKLGVVNNKNPDETAKHTAPDLPKPKTMMKKGGMTHKQETKVGKVMGEYKQGMLHSGSKTGPEVSNDKQALAIAMSEARAMGKRKK